jgi:hypothetical protein
MHCGTAYPTLHQRWNSGGHLIAGARAASKPGRLWGPYRLHNCGAPAAKSNMATQKTPIRRRLPIEISNNSTPPKTVYESVPEPARSFLRQAHETLHAPDTAASAVDAMLKERKYYDGLCMTGSTGLWRTIY